MNQWMWTDVLDKLPMEERKRAIQQWARNETRVIKPEDEDEKVVGWARRLQVASETDEEIYKQLRSEG